MFLLTFIILANLSIATYANIGNGLVIVVVSQEDNYHKQLAVNLKKQVIKEELGVKIHLSHEDYSHSGAWTLFPLLTELNNSHGHNSTWLFFCDSRTNFSLVALLDVLKDYDPGKEVWLGHALADEFPTIIHHYAFKENEEQLKYPLFASGFAITTVLLRSLARRLSESGGPTHHFSIDAQYEFSQFVSNDGEGPSLEHHPLICSSYQQGCIAYPQHYSSCISPVTRNTIYFAVKTCKKFHKDRVPVVKETWGKYAGNIEFYSDIEDETIPSISLGIPNTELGHCAKTFAIIHRISNSLYHFPHMKWIIIADDDTILSVSRLQELLSCFSPDIPIALGERYGFNIHNTRGGYNYITGGGGIVLSFPAVNLIAKTSECHCPDISSPDDMFLGWCLTALGIPIIHVPSFHQARPEDYAKSYLESHKPVSFHKHWLIDPRQVYKDFFAADDEQDPSVHRRHFEL